jgi:ABC-type lipoprotein release transport system permease subunit
VGPGAVPAQLALAAVWAHPLRSFLTLFGMIIGMASFMVVLSILQGFNSYVDEKIAGIGSNSFTVSRFSFEDFGNSDKMAAARRSLGEEIRWDVESGKPLN